MTEEMFRLEPVAGEAMAPSHLTAPAAFTTPDRTERNLTRFATADSSVASGFWECAPSREEIESYPVHEMMTVVAGAVTVTHADGRAERFGPGDTLFIAKGTRCTWEITETLRKFYMVAS